MSDNNDWESKGWANLWKNFINPFQEAGFGGNHFDPSTGFGLFNQAGQWPNLGNFQSSPFSGEESPQNTLQHSLISMAMNQSMLFLLVSQQCMKLYQSAMDQGVNAKWQQESQNTFNQLQQFLYGPYGGGHTQGVNPFGTFSQFIPGLNGDGLSSFYSASMRKMVKQWLSLPSVGQNRELVSLLQSWMSEADEHQTSVLSYLREFNQVGIDGLNHLRERFTKICTNGEKLHSLRSVYNLWVDCNEEAYEKWIYNKEFPKIYGKLVNTQIRLHRTGNQIYDRMAKLFGQPTKQGMSSLLERQHVLRNQVRSLTDKLDALSQQLNPVNSTKASRATRSTAKTGATKRSTVNRKGVVHSRPKKR